MEAMYVVRAQIHVRVLRPHGLTTYHSVLTDPGRYSAPQGPVSNDSLVTLRVRWAGQTLCRHSQNMKQVDIPCIFDSQLHVGYGGVRHQAETRLMKRRRVVSMA